MNIAHLIRSLLWLVLVVILVGFGVLFKGLYLDKSSLPSPLINKALPALEAPMLHTTDAEEPVLHTTDAEAPVLHTTDAEAPSSPDVPFSSQSLLGQVWVLNVFASWCLSCIPEMPVLQDLVTQSGVTIIGLNYKDKPDAARQWLAKWGNPYTKVATDLQGLLAIDLGVYGVPETFIIDSQGIIRDKIIGELTAETAQDRVMPLLQRLMKKLP